MRWMDRILPVGARSVLFGAHQFLIHPCFVAAAWCRLYGYPLSLPIWVSFFVHDLGYLFLGCRNMDGPEGERHPEFGAAIMRRLFGEQWGEFTLLHSRYYSKRLGKPISRLCVADKFAICLTPWWVYVPLATLSGEVTEYMGETRAIRYGYERTQAPTPRSWHAEVQDYLRGWVREQQDGRADTWTAAGAGR